MYQHHDIEIVNQNTYSSNVLNSMANTLMQPILFPPNAQRAIDATLETPYTFYDLILERSDDSVSLETSDSAFVYETHGELLMEFDLDGRDRIIAETVDYLLLEDGSGTIIQELLDTSLDLVTEDGSHATTESGYDVPPGFPIPQQEYVEQKFDAEHTVLQGLHTLEETFLELEISDGGETSVRQELLGYFPVEDNTTETIRILQEKNGPSYILNEDFENVLVQEDDGFSRIVNEDANTYSSDYVLMEPVELFDNIVSDNIGDEFNIRTEADGDYFFIRQEPGDRGGDTNGDFILLEDGITSPVSTTGDRLFGFSRSRVAP